MDLKLTGVRLSFPDLFKAVEYQTGDGKFRFNATFLVAPGSANDKLIRDAIRKEADAAYGKKADSMLKAWENNANKFAYLDGNLKEYDGYEGMMYLACHTKTRPLILDENKNPLAEEDGKPYAGCYVNAVVSIYAQKGENAGIRASFSGVQFARNGDAFSAGKAATADDFDVVEDGSDAGDLI